MLDEVELATDPDLPEPPPVAAFPVPDARGIVRHRTANRQSVLVAADGEGLVDAAVGRACSTPTRPSSTRAALVDGPRRPSTTIYDDDADLLLTDTNRTRARRWGALRENTGYTERAGEEPLSFDPTDQRLDVFPGAGDDDATVSRAARRDGLDHRRHRHRHRLRQPHHLHPRRPAGAAPSTATRSRRGASAPSTRSSARSSSSTSTSRSPPTTINLLQPINLERTRWITKVKLTFDDGDVDGRRPRRDLARRERRRPGRRHSASARSRSSPSRSSRPTSWAASSSTGSAASASPRCASRASGVEELVRPPVDLLDRAGDVVDRPPPHAALHPPALEPGRAGAHRRGERHPPGWSTCRRPARSRSAARPASSAGT